jgi:hypothetical protein
MLTKKSVTLSKVQDQIISRVTKYDPLKGKILKFNYEVAEAFPAVSVATHTNLKPGAVDELKNEYSWLPNPSKLSKSERAKKVHEVRMLIKAGFTKHAGAVKNILGNLEVTKGMKSAIEPVSDSVTFKSPRDVIDMMKRIKESLKDPRNKIETLELKIKHWPKQ